MDPSLKILVLRKIKAEAVRGSLNEGGRSPTTTSNSSIARLIKQVIQLQLDTDGEVTGTVLPSSNLEPAYTGQ